MIFVYFSKRLQYTYIFLADYIGENSTRRSSKRSTIMVSPLLSVLIPGKASLCYDCSRAFRPSASSRCACVVSRGQYREWLALGSAIGRHGCAHRSHPLADRDYSKEGIKVPENRRVSDDRVCLRCCVINTGIVLVNVMGQVKRCPSKLDLTNSPTF